MPTAGGHQLLPPDELAALLRGLGEVIAERFTMPYETVVVTATRPGRRGEGDPVMTARETTRS
ncbi:hypothetical protein [Actinoplanes sp. G11-F43]|uniref:hypothetical protein n=1 Tax=Actinoplanes sp. G11-F43 TaxID=3424130 RepID=UPI003D339F9A